MNFLKKIFGTKNETKTPTYADFWHWFGQHQKEFYQVVRDVKDAHEMESRFFNRLSPKLDELGEGFYFLAGMTDQQTAELVITSDGIIKNIVFAEELIQAAPSIEGWKFTALKQGLDIANVYMSMGGLLFNKDNMSFYSNDDDQYPDKIDITLIHHDYTENNKDAISNGSLIFLDNILGELNSVSIIDSMTFISPTHAQKELIPIEKLSAFLNWRQKEFVEKYDGKRYRTEADNYSILQAEMDGGLPLIAIINTDLISWDAKASHPWLAIFEIKYDGSKNNGMPDEKNYEKLSAIEDELLSYLKDSDGYLNVGRETFNGARDIYFACNDFRKPSKVFSEIAKKYSNQFEISYNIFKDKYWESLSRFQQ